MLTTWLFTAVFKTIGAVVLVYFAIYLPARFSASVRRRLPDGWVKKYLFTSMFLWGSADSSAANASTPSNPLKDTLDDPSVTRRVSGE